MGLEFRWTGQMLAKWPLLYFRKVWVGVWCEKQSHCKWCGMMDFQIGIRPIQLWELAETLKEEFWVWRNEHMGGHVCLSPLGVTASVTCRSCCALVFTTKLQHIQSRTSRHWRRRLGGSWRTYGSNLCPMSIE